MADLDYTTEELVVAGFEAINLSLAKRVSYDEAQVRTDAQRKQARDKCQWSKTINLCDPSRI